MSSELLSRPHSDLSFSGLLRRIELVEELRAKADHTDEELAALSSDGSAKKAVADQLPGLADKGMTAKEKSGAQRFLELQIKSIDYAVKGADKREAKLKELLDAVKGTPSADEPTHVLRAKKAVDQAEKDYKEIHKVYEQWEKGKKMLAVEELKALKKSHEDAIKRVEASKNFVHLQMHLRPEAAAKPTAAMAAPKSAPAPSAGKGASKAGPQATNVRGGGPAARTLGMSSAPAARGSVGGGGYAAGGYPAASVPASGGAYSALSAPARQAYTEEYYEEEWPARAPRPQAPKPSKPKVEEPGPVLSYAFTVKAFAKFLGTKEDTVRSMAESVAEFKELVVSVHGKKEWKEIEEQSLALEKQEQEKKREAEKKKREAALARATEQAIATAVPKIVPKSQPVAKAKAPAAGGAPKAKAKSGPAPTKKSANTALATGNHFAAMGGDSSDEDDGWTTVGR